MIHIFKPSGSMKWVKKKATLTTRSKVKQRVHACNSTVRDPCCDFSRMYTQAAPTRQRTCSVVNTIDLFHILDPPKGDS